MEFSSSRVKLFLKDIALRRHLLLNAFRLPGSNNHDVAPEITESSGPAVAAHLCDVGRYDRRRR
jgi:hypothetical protein